MCMLTIKLDKTLSQLGVSRYELSQKTGINYQIINKYYKNEAQRYDKYTLERICEALNCDISDILELK